MNQLLKVIKIESILSDYMEDFPFSNSILQTIQLKNTKSLSNSIVSIFLKLNKNNKKLDEMIQLAISNNIIKYI